MARRTESEQVQRGSDPVAIRTYRDLVAWQVGMDLAAAVLRAADRLPTDQRFALGMQMRRAAVSVPSNIAEGFGRGAAKEFRRFLVIARGSLFELQTQAELARRMGWLQGAALREVRELSHRLDALVAGLLKALPRRMK